MQAFEYSLYQKVMANLVLLEMQESKNQHHRHFMLLYQTVVIWESNYRL